MNLKNSRKIAELINENRYFFIPYIIFITISSIFIIYFGHKNSFLILNKINCPFLDGFFYLSTNVGNGIFTLIVVFILIFVKIRWSLYLFLGYISSGAFTQIIKNLTKLPRPKAVFEHSEAIHYVQGIDVHLSNSFPSGHSASAFALFFVLTLMTKNNFLKLLFFFCAVLVSYSRVYLVQHFPIDIVIGSFLGIFFTFAIYLIIENKFNPQMLDSSFIDFIPNAKRKK